MNSTKTHLSVSATGDDLVFLWVVAHSPERCVGDHHLKTHKPPTAGNDAEDTEDVSNSISSNRNSNHHPRSGTAHCSLIWFKMFQTKKTRATTNILVGRYISVSAYMLSDISQYENFCWYWTNWGRIGLLYWFPWRFTIPVQEFFILQNDHVSSWRRSWFRCTEGSCLSD